MRKLLFISFLIAANLQLLAQEIPAIYSNLGNDGNGIYLNVEGRKIYAFDANDEFKFSDLYGNPAGTRHGILLDFKYPKLTGILYYGFINYGDGNFPQTVYFRESAKIQEGKSFIPIAGVLSGKYDMINWEKTGRGVLGYRIISENGEMLYDGKLGFTYKNGSFSAAPTLIEGPFINKLSSKSLVISFTTTQPVKANIKVDGKTYGKKKARLNHEIEIDDLQPNTKYDYTLTIGEFEFKYTFETAPEPGTRTKFSFAYSSDSRAGNGGGERNIYGTNAYIMKRIAALAKAEGVKFMQFTGDLINGYETSRERMNLQYSNWKHAVEPFWHHMPIIPAFGNHEAYNYIFPDANKNVTYMIDHFPFDNDSGESLFQDNFVLPENGPLSEDDSAYDPDVTKIDFPSYKESVYWYAYDNAAVVVLNSDYWYAPQGNTLLSGNLHAYIMDNQMKWLEKTLENLENNKNIDHVFVSIHTPFFPNGGHVKDDMWYNGDNQPRSIVNNKKYEQGIIQRRDELLDIIINKNKKTLALLTGDEHNYNLLNITDEMPRYPANYIHEKLKLSRKFYQINNGAAGAPYYAKEVTPWMDHLRNFSTQNAVVIIEVEGSKVHVRVKNPDTLDLIDEYDLRE